MSKNEGADLMSVTEVCSEIQQSIAKKDAAKVSLAQLVEHLTLNQAVVGSIPTRDTKWSLSSVGRAPPLQGGCHKFESYSDHHAAVVQMVRMPPCHGGGRGFEPRPLRHLFFNFLSDFV